MDKEEEDVTGDKQKEAEALCRVLCMYGARKEHTLPATLGRHTLSSGPAAPHQVVAQIIAAGRISDGGAAVGLHADTVGSVGKDLPSESEIP